MKLICLYGPPAVGKLTVAKVLSQKIRYALLHNHLLVNPIAEVIPFENPTNWKLVREFRLRIIEEAIKSNINIIITFAIAGNNPFSHISDIIKTVEAGGGEMYLVQLSADKETILNRVEEQSRKIHGKNLSRTRLEEIINENYDMFDAYKYKNHTTINTTHISPDEAAKRIIMQSKFSL